MSTRSIPLFALFWPRLTLALVFVGIPALLVGATVWWAGRRARRDLLAGSARRATAGRLAGLTAGAAAGVLAYLADQGALAPAMVGLGYLLGVLAAELLGAPRPAGTVRSASLQTRRASWYLPRWAVVTALAAGLVTIAAPFAAALLQPMRYGLFINESANAASRYSAWLPITESLPLMLVAAAALAAGAVLVRRAVLRPADAAQPEAGERVRRNTVRAVAGAVAGVELLALAALATLISGPVGIAASPGSFGYVGSQVLNWGSFSLVLAAIVIWSVLGWWQRSPDVPPPSPPAPGSHGPHAPAGPAAA